VLFLGAGGLSLYPAVVLAMVAELHLEAVARLALSSSPNAAGVATAVSVLRQGVVDLQRTGVLATRPHLGSYPVDLRVSPARVAAAAALVPLHDPSDIPRLAAAPLVFEPGERPFATGILPPFSAAGYLCYIARATDPADAMGPSTGQMALLRRRQDADARRVARAVTEALREA